MTPDPAALLEDLALDGLLVHLAPNRPGRLAVTVCNGSPATPDALDVIREHKPALLVWLARERDAAAWLDAQPKAIRIAVVRDTRRRHAEGWSVTEAELYAAEAARAGAGGAVERPEPRAETPAARLARTTPAPGPGASLPGPSAPAARTGGSYPDPRHPRFQPAPRGSRARGRGNRTS
jgi:hypothetical protein